MLVGRTLCLHPSSRIARENLEVFCDTWAQSVNELSRLAKESDAICYGRVAAEKQAYMSLPKPGVIRSSNYLAMSSSNLSLYTASGVSAASNAKHYYAAPVTQKLPSASTPIGAGRLPAIASFPLHARPGAVPYYGSLDSVFVNVCTPDYMHVKGKDQLFSLDAERRTNEEILERRNVKQSLSLFEKSVSDAVKKSHMRPSTPSLFDCSPMSMNSCSLIELSSASFHNGVCGSLPCVAQKYPSVDGMLERQLDEAVEQLLKNMNYHKAN